jgi:hypothetical protein
VSKPRFKPYAVTRLFRRESYLHKLGWFESYKARAPVDADGEPIPLLTYPALDFLRRRVPEQTEVFEYGSGYSTLWWARRVLRVEAVEHHEGWYERVRAQAPKNVRLHLIPLEPDGAYCRKILEYNSVFDLVVIDGRDRVRCARNALGALKPSGVVIWDDSNRDKYQEGLGWLRDQGFRQIAFTGLTATSERQKETSILYRPDNVLGL